MSDLAKLESNGGQYALAVAAGTGGAGAALTGGGRLCKVVVMSQGSVATDIYDNTAASGTKIFTVPASGTTAKETGTVYDLQIPVTTGIYVAGAANTSGLTVTYSKDKPYGR